MRTVIIPLRGFLNSGFRKLRTLRILVKKQGLHFSNQEKIGDHIIGLDTTKRKLLFTRTTLSDSSCLIVDLNNLETCSIKKEYMSIDAGALKTRKLNHFLKKVFLNLVFKNGSEEVSLPLFNAQKEELKNLEQLEVQAKRWESIVLNVLPLRISASA